MSSSISSRSASVFLVLSFLLVLVVGSTAYASDSSQLNPIGFSRDGKIFAYEEYGVQDGSGFAYSNIFFIDTDVDKHLPGTPIKVLVENDESVARIRKLARDKAAPLIAQYDLENNPGKIVAYNPVTEVDSDPHRLRYYEYYSLLSRSGSFTIELKEKPFPAPKNCLNMTGDFKGFSLTFTEVSSEATTRLIHEDIQVPASRNCPNGYRLGAIVTSDVDAAATIAMIQVSTFGFEGNDERWIAVTARLLERPQ